LHVTDLTNASHFERELVLINVKTETGTAMQTVLSLVSRNHLRVAEVMEDGLIIEATGEWKQINALVEELMPFGIRHIVRTGTVAVWKQPSAEMVNLVGAQAQQRETRAAAVQKEK
jgi:acetolactate synthase I/III small subunit